MTVGDPQDQRSAQNCVLPGVKYLPEFISDRRKKKHTSFEKSKNRRNRNGRCSRTDGGEVTSKGILYGQPLPDFIRKFPDIISRIKETGVFADSPHKEPNHVIMNEPHEDGPIYHPVVATLTLGSQCVFHYYQYKDRGEESPTDSSASTGKGRPIDPKPVHSLLLERRSLVISFGDLYTSHLHGTTQTPPGSSGVESTATRIDNFHLLRDEGLKEAIRQGQSIKRETRWSLTCRDVSRTASLGIRSLRIG
ncbi:hypothetical protein CC1G_01637 [Coprinopsis cinerea okayama7|uniref:Fe2OG dioxygenase domain-containing protein n=1 Tax=Coprinopsis cinerea (strain Okayama-7 / 130 / ATCC MYA-4618 / FGSC 9003) TaxID=240176 RepID=A8NIB7_COPC7|nr:hypothetical protein CC1G_01637 [Coprinopsis cinerea okayama7\|eukprot:XP_001833960.2 hypothetical protein CC1G_01637 [Coprinopsis cinerea okayama7\